MVENERVHSELKKGAIRTLSAHSARYNDPEALHSMQINQELTCNNVFSPL